MKTIVAIIATVLVIMGLFRVGNALLIHDQATVFVNPVLCPGLGGELKNDMCIVKADMSHELFSGDAVLRLKDGREAHIRNGDVLGVGVTSSRYGLSW